MPANPSGQSIIAEEWDAEGNRSRFVGEYIFPIIDVAQAGGKVHRIAREEFTKEVDTIVGADGKPQQVLFGDETFTYATEREHLEVPITRRIRNMVRTYYDAEVAGTRIALAKLRQEFERRAVSRATDTGTITEKTGYTAWATAASATPIANVKEQAIIIEKATGMKPNRLVLNQTQFDDAIATTEVLDRVSGGATKDNPAEIQPAELAALMHLSDVRIAGGVKDSANPGAAHSGAYFWPDDHVLLFFSRTVPDITTLQLGGTYHWDGDGSQAGYVVERYDETPHRQIVGAWRDTDPRVQYPECGILIKVT